MMSKYEGLIDSIPQKESTIQLDTTRERLLQVAEELFAEKGFAGTSLRQIGAVLGIANSSIMYYFPTKKKLYMAVLDRVADSMKSVLEVINTFGSDPVQDFITMIESSMVWVNENPGRVRLLLREMMENSERLEQARSFVLSNVQRNMRSPIDQIQSQGGLGLFNPDLFLLHILGSITYFSVAKPSINRIIEKKDPSDINDQIKETIINAVYACLNANPNGKSIRYGFDPRAKRCE